MSKTPEQPLVLQTIPEISAIYFALLQCGYDFYTLGRDAEHGALLAPFVDSVTVPRFFTDVRQTTCEPYPYWPRAAILETASFFLTPDRRSFADFDAFHAQVMRAGNIADNERGQALWDWIADFPAALSAVLDSPAFARYADWEAQFLAAQSMIHEDELTAVASALKICRCRFGSQFEQIRLAICPIKCACSADYHLHNGTFIFSSGAFRADSVIHEFLHHIVHPFVETHTAEILAGNTEYPGIDASYYLNGDDIGKCNAFEEYTVRRLTDDIVNGRAPIELRAYLPR